MMKPDVLIVCVHVDHFRENMAIAEAYASKDAIILTVDDVKDKVTKETLEELIKKGVTIAKYENEPFILDRHRRFEIDKIDIEQPYIAKVPKPYKPKLSKADRKWKKPS